MTQTSLTAWLQKPMDRITPVQLAQPTLPNTTGQTDPIPRQVYGGDLKVSENINVAESNSDIHSELELSIKAESSIVMPFANPRPIPINAHLAHITSENIQLFRRLINLLLPVPYSDKFFSETVADPVANSISRVIVWNENARIIRRDSSNGSSIATASTSSKARVVAGIRCRLLTTSPARQSEDQSVSLPSLYISTIATLSPYQGYGLATALLSEVTTTAADLYRIGTVTAHVWEANDEAREWYAKKGFREVKREPNYYTRIKPTGAWLLECVVSCPS